MHVLTKNKKAGLGLVVTSLLLMAGSAFAASQVEYVLQLGGDNHAASIKAGTYVSYTPGNSADGQAFPIGTQITWDAVLKASGTQGSGPGAGSAIKGVANFVFDLELRQGSANGPIVDLPVFVSSIHDGGSECIPSGGTIPEGLCPPCLAGASFAFSYNVWGIYGNGRVVEPPWRGGAVSCSGYPNLPAGGGPNMNVCLYPTIENGKLLGMGAGYQRWIYGSGSTTTWSVSGVGLASGGLGQIPVVEGQIDTDDLAPGTYFLKLIPKSGTNVLRGDISLTTTQNAFATTAENLVGSTRWFVIEGCDGPEDCDDGLLCTDDACVSGICENTPVDCGGDVCDPDTGVCVECYDNSHCGPTEECVDNECVPTGPAPTLVSAVSTHVHNATTFSMNVPLAAAEAPVEPRYSGPSTVVLTFSEPMEATDGQLELGDEVVVSSGVGTASFLGDNSMIEISLTTPPTNQTCFVITLSGLRGAASKQDLDGDNDLHIISLVGDVTQSKLVDITDLGVVKSQLYKPLTEANYLCDIDKNGTIDITDLGLVKAQLYKGATCP